MPAVNTHLHETFGDQKGDFDGPKAGGGSRSFDRYGLAEPFDPNDRFAEPVPFVVKAQAVIGTVSICGAPGATRLRANEHLDLSEVSLVMCDGARSQRYHRALAKEHRRFIVGGLQD